MTTVVQDIADKMQKSIETYQKELTRIRTGRASLSLLDGVKVQAYGSPMPLNQVASLTIPESRMIAIQPWDPHLIGEIEKSIYKADLGLNPVSDGKIVRINIPQPLTCRQTGWQIGSWPRSILSAAFSIFQTGF